MLKALLGEAILVIALFGQIAVEKKGGQICKGVNMLIKKKFVPLFRGLTATMFSLAILSSIGYGIADTWRGTVDSALGTTSYETDTTDAKYTSDYSTAKEVMNELKAVAVQEGIEGTALLKNDNQALPLVANTTINLWGAASYNPYRGMNQAKNTDAVDLVAALKAHGFTIDSTLENIYANINENHKTIQTNMWTGAQTTVYDYPNQSAPSYGDYKIMEVNPNKFTQSTFGEASATWADGLKGDINIVTFARPGGEGSTYKPGATQDEDGNKLDQNPFAFSPSELAIIDAAKATGKPTIVLLNTSCQFELGPIIKGGAHEVDAIAYIGLPNDYQFTGIVQVLAGDVNATGALADTYAISSTSSPSMENFGGDLYSDYTLGATATNEDVRWPNGVTNELAASSFTTGGNDTYNGGGYYVEAEGIYTGYNYYETRFFDSIVNASFNADSTAGSIDGSAWDYSKEVAYTFGYGLSYLDYSEELVDVTVDKSVSGNITATIKVTNNSQKDGMFRAELYVNSPYTQYDRDNKVEKSAIQFLNSAKVEVKAGQSENVTIEVPTKYIASYDYTTAKTYILDGGDYYFTIGNGAHEAVNNVITSMGYTGDIAGNTSKVKIWNNGSESDTDKITFNKSEIGSQITNHLESSDLNYYLPGTVTYLSRSNWKDTYPKNYNTVNDGKGVSIAASEKKDEWLKNIRNQQRMVKDNDPVQNFDGIDKGLTWENMPASAVENINDPWWDEYVAQIPAEEAVGAVAHGGSQADTLTNIENPIVKQYDGPAGFNDQTMASNDAVDENSEEGQFKDNVHSQTLEGSSFNPELAYRWGRALGNFGLWANVYNIWAGGLNVHRNPYNARNIEYLSEDAMLTNILGREFLKATLEKGLIVGPKHLGFNDQEYNRAGTAVYLNEQKARETDLRGFQGAIEDAGALAYMCAFNRLGATNVSHYRELHVDLIRSEWGYKGLITTDFMSNNHYFNPESCINATVTQMADFAGNNSHLNLGDGGKDATWTYLSPEAIKNDNALVESARTCMKYQLFAFSQTAVKNLKTYRVTPWWETTLVTLTSVFYVLSAASVVFLGLTYVPSKADKEEK